MTTRKRNASSSREEDEYRKKRERNNLAVKKCRIKSNEQAKEIKAKTEELKSMNKFLKGRIEEKMEHIQSVLGLILQKDASPEIRARIAKIMEPVKSGTESRS